MADIGDRIFATCNRGVSSLHESREPVNTDAAYRKGLIAFYIIRQKKEKPNWFQSMHVKHLYK